MGAMAPYWNVLPVPDGGLPTNAALLATQHLSWAVAVKDGDEVVETTVEQLQQIGALTGQVVVIRPTAAAGWPARRELQIVATLAGSSQVSAAVRTGAGPERRPPRCDWRGPVAPAPRVPALAAAIWPTNVPRPPENQRSFSLGALESDAGYLVIARIRLQDRKQVATIEGALRTGASVDVPISPSWKEISDAARIVALELEDMAGNVARYGA